MKTCADGHESGTNGHVGPLRRFLGQVHKVPATGAVVTGAVVMGAIVTQQERENPCRFFQRLALPIFQIADFSEARLADFSDRRFFQRLASPIWANLDAGKKKTLPKK
jgi:hypothetical protein